jgi:uncharacterized protein with LGFP repeats
MHNAIAAKWLALGGNSSFLGTFTGRCGVCPDGRGAYAHFADGSIYWHPDVGAFETHGAIRD